MISDLLCYADSVTPVSAETVGNHIGQTPLHFPQVQFSLESGFCRNSRQSHRPNTTTLSTSSAFIGIRSYTSIQPSLGAQFHTSCIFYKFPVRYLECKGQAPGKQLWIHDHKCRRTVSMSTDWVGVLSILDFLVLDGRILRFAGWHHSKKGRHQGCFCSWTLQIAKNS